MSLQGSRASRMLLAASIALGGSAISSAAHSYQPGWYFEFGGASVMVEDSDGNLQVRQRSTDNTPCQAGDPGGLGGQFVSNGCLADLFGPGTTEGGETIFPRASSEMRFKDGLGLHATIGYLLEGGLRPELSFLYATNDVDRATFQNIQGNTELYAESGELETLRFMANAWYDLDFGTRFVPYIGGGLGYQRAKLELDIVEEANTDVRESGNETSGFAYQLGAGLGFLLSDRTTLSLDYRYLLGDDFETHSTITSTTTEGTTTTTSTRNEHLEQEFRAQSLGLSLRHSFGEGGGRDSDGDGVPDRLDKCPNTPKGVQVYSDGCPLDVDGDGVPDYLDKCPGTPKGTPVDVNGCPADSDGDGVPDHLDKCPSTPRGVMVGPDGCPIDGDGDGVPDAYDKCPDTARGTIVGPDGCPAPDSDGDGVPDFADKCPNTPKGVAVGADGCPLDSDGDGIPDYLDECPKSPPGAKVLPNGCALIGDCRRPRPGEAVDANGCALDKNFILRGVKFEFDSDRLTEPAKQILNEVAETLKGYPGISVDLEGHTDNVGTDAYNLGLSERRANAVKTYLTSKEIESNRMNPVGYGESRPIDSNESEEGRENNRRVELRVVE